jgi:hypothetical protein
MSLPLAELRGCRAGVGAYLAEKRRQVGDGRG